jgi:hypothetical protein
MLTPSGRLRLIAALFALFACVAPFTAEQGFPIVKSVVSLAIAVSLYFRHPLSRWAALVCIALPLLILVASPIIFIVNGGSPHARPVLGLSESRSTLIVLGVYILVAIPLAWAFITLCSRPIRALFARAGAVA